MPKITEIAIDNTIYPVDEAVATNGIDTMLAHMRFGNKNDNSSYIAFGNNKQNYIEFTLQNSGNSTKEINSDTIIFHIKAFLDIQYQAIERELKESIILKSRPPVNSLTFGYNLVGVNAEKVGNSINFYEDIDGENGKLLFYMSKPTAVDNNSSQANVAFDIDKLAQTFTLSVDGAWLDNATYPVIIDPTVATTTDVGALYSGANFHAHYANGYYWVAFHNGTAPHIYSSNDAFVADTTDTGAIFTAAPGTTDEWAVRYVGTDVHAVKAASSTSNVTYRHGALENDGSITWDSEATITDSDYHNQFAWEVGSAEITWISDDACWRLNGSWVQLDTFDRADFGTTISGYALVSCDDAGDFKAITHRTGSTIQEMNFRGWDDSTSTKDGSTTSITGDNHTTYNTSWIARRFTANRFNSEIHTINVDEYNSNQLLHYKRADSGSFALVTTAIGSVTSAERVCVCANGTGAYVFYDKGDNGVYYREYSGGSWGGETELKTADSNTLQGAISCYESVQNSAIGVVWVEGTGSPYDVIFGLVSLGGAPTGYPYYIYANQ